MPTVATRTKKPPALGTLIDKLSQIRERKREQESIVKAIDEEFRALESEVITRMIAEAADKIGGKAATASLSKAVVPQVENWDLFYSFIGKNKYYHMLERRPSVAAYREMLELKGEVPGVSAFTKTTLNLRNN